MSLTELHIHHLRNITTARFTLHPRFNIFQGANGSGKTSLLEAVYLLSTGHSFRTREIAPLISNGQPHLTVFAATETDGSVSIQKSVEGPTLVKLNKQACYNSSDLARFLPCQVFYQDIFQIIDAGPGVRRGVLDWGLFHVKQTYHALWKDYRRVLKQRNALLRQKAPRSQFAPWDNLLSSLSVALDECRADHFIDLSARFQEVIAQLADITCSLRYYKGWDKKNSGKAITTILEEQFNSDVQRQYTQSGAHQADIMFEVDVLKAKQSLSRGQQKIILIALKLAQAQLVARPCIYLLDDIAAELDAVHLQRLFDFLAQMRGQFFLTTIEFPTIPMPFKSESSFFTIDDGLFQAVSRETERNREQVMGKKEKAQPCELSTIAL